MADFTSRAQTVLATLIRYMMKFALLWCSFKRTPIDYRKKRNYFRRVVYFLEFAGRYCIEGVPPPGLYAVIEMNSPKNPKDLLEIHSRQSLKTKTW